MSKMLLQDNIKEVAYQTDYFTTIKFLELFPNLSTNNFWNEKWIKMYSTENYIKSQTRQDNFLLKEKNNFIVVFTSTHSGHYHELYNNVVYEYNNHVPYLSEKYRSCLAQYLKFVSISVNKQFIVIKKNNTPIMIYNSDDFCEAENYIENYIKKKSCNEKYTIINMDDMVTRFTDVDMERKSNNKTCVYEYYSWNFHKLKFP